MQSDEGLKVHIVVLHCQLNLRDGDDFRGLIVVIVRDDGHDRDNDVDMKLIITLDYSHNGLIIFCVKLNRDRIKNARLKPLN